MKDRKTTIVAGDCWLEEFFWLFRSTSERLHRFFGWILVASVFRLGAHWVPSVFFGSRWVSFGVHVLHVGRSWERLSSILKVVGASLFAPGM